MRCCPQACVALVRVALWVSPIVRSYGGFHSLVPRSARTTTLATSCWRRSQSTTAAPAITAYVTSQPWRSNWKRKARFVVWEFTSRRACLKEVLSARGQPSYGVGPLCLIVVDVKIIKREECLWKLRRKSQRTTTTLRAMGDNIEKQHSKPTLQTNMIKQHAKPILVLEDSLVYIPHVAAISSVCPPRKPVDSRDTHAGHPVHLPRAGEPEDTAFPTGPLPRHPTILSLPLFTSAHHDQLLYCYHFTSHSTLNISYNVYRTSCVSYILLHLSNCWPALSYLFHVSYFTCHQLLTSIFRRLRMSRCASANNRGRVTGRRDVTTQQQGTGVTDVGLTFSLGVAPRKNVEGLREGRRGTLWEGWTIEGRKKVRGMEDGRKEGGEGMYR